MFSTYLRDKAKITDPLKVFHSFRHYFCDQANNLTQYDQARIFDITGHKREGEFNLTYARELHWQTKLAILNDIPLPTLKLPVYTPGMFLSNLKATKVRLASKKAAEERPRIASGQKPAQEGKKPEPAEAAPKRFTLKASRKKAAKTGQPGT